MLRYKTETRPGLVALYDIRPGNGAGPFLQPRSPHGAPNRRTDVIQGETRRAAGVLLESVENCITGRMRDKLSSKQVVS